MMNEKRNEAGIPPDGLQGKKDERVKCYTERVPQFILEDDLSLHDKSIHFLRTRTVTEITPTELPDDLLDNWIIEHMEGCKAAFSAAHTELEARFVLPVGMFYFMYGAHDRIYADSLGDELYRTPVATISDDFFRWQYVLRIVREARRQGVKLPEVNIFDFYHYGEILTGLRPLAEWLGVSAEL